MTEHLKIDFLPDKSRLNLTTFHKSKSESPIPCIELELKYVILFSETVVTFKNEHDNSKIYELQLGVINFLLSLTV